MNYEFNVFSLWLLISSAISLFIARYSWKMRIQKTGFYLFFLTLAAAQWSLAGVFEAAATSVSLKTLWSQISYLGIVAAPVFYLLFSWSYSNRDDLITPKTVTALSIIPALTFLIAMTNDYHQLLWPEVSITETGNIGIYGHGIGFFVNMGYSYLLIVIGIGAILRSTKHTSFLYTDQQRIIISGALIPLVANSMYVFKINPIPGLDWTPISFGISGLLFALGIFHFGMLNLVPIARNFLVETMEDGMMVLDLEDYIIDVNPAMATLLGKRDAEIIGREINAVLSEWEKLLILLNSNDECDVVVPGPENGDPGEQISVKVSSIVWAGSRLYGRLLTCRRSASDASKL
ncbi:MAG: PAS domain-containing protein [Candidatus Marinimicrobia bacterium]|nr:PAS domain-containing protein [Candidatus Neomarinimicrobiota bacterium]